MCKSPSMTGATAMPRLVYDSLLLPAARALVQEEQKRAAALLPLLEETPSEAGLALSEAIRARLDFAACGARRLAI